MPKKKTLNETLPEPQELPAEQTEGADAPSEMFPESVGEETAAETSREPESDAEAKATPKTRSRSKARPAAEAADTGSLEEDPPEGESDAVGSPIEDGYPAGEIPDIVSVEFENGDGGAMPPEADIPYGEEPNAGELAGSEAKETAADLIPEPQPEAAFSGSEPELVAPTERPSEPNPAIPEPDTPMSERRAFFGLDFRELDRGLTPEQRQEWNSIYASYRGRNVMSGQVIGVDRVRLRIQDRKTGELVWRRVNCAIVVPFRVRILIPESEMWMTAGERPSFVLRNIPGSTVDFVIISVNREQGVAIASRRMALPSRRYFFSTQPDMNRPGARISCNVLAVGPRRCLVSCNGYDLNLTQREMSYTAIADLREKYHNGDKLDCIVKEYDRRNNRLLISVKETVPNPFDGADFRHPEGSHRYAIIAGKYAGGVFCNLPDGVTVMCHYAFHYDDSAFRSGDRVQLIIQRYDMEKKQIYGKIVAKV